MLRWILEELVLFALPFLAFAGVLLLLRRNPLQAGHWEAQWLRLVLAGLFVVVASLLMTGLTAVRHPDGYVPPHMENGRLVPGQFQ
ncbi:DUF6111 family protein [Methylobacterium haplocladii]|uniref:Uncharacterized protein n=1 Tax=Methylobacterium haplocladii TaxID=1176176 RepID=A0A512IMR6_9HYPH|nr:DUF6111 family protein [Methylobacterium haplocladii]GEO99006.1 hypothetical protein MHA02_13940 [Methylobacterium haplocladii]GJD84147.1 hypothetical protein HPGCJGGD_2022 [Methylobacterium haplocladii]GLS61542.1 hypothetical protein GCM10007887_42630 [Methylobacterium haplocladii]